MSDKGEVKPINEVLLSYLENNLQINIIHNRFDLLYKDFHLIVVDGIDVPCIVDSREVRTGLYLTPLSDSQMTELRKYTETGGKYRTSLKLYLFGEKLIKLIASVLLRKECHRTFRMFIEKKHIKK